MLRPGAVRRGMRERNAPPHRVRPRRERLVEERPVLGELEQTVPLEEALLRRIDAEEFDVRAVAEAVEQPGTVGGAAGGFFTRDPLTAVKVVLDLRAVVAFLRFGRVVI